MAEDTAGKDTKPEWTPQDITDRFKTAVGYFRPLTDYFQMSAERLGLGTHGQEKPDLGWGEFTLKIEDGSPSFELRFTEPSADKDRIMQSFYIRGGDETKPSEFRHAWGKKVGDEFVKTGERVMHAGAKTDLSCSLAEIDESLQDLKRYSDNIPTHAVWPQGMPQGKPQN